MPSFEEFSTRLRANIQLQTWNSWALWKPSKNLHHSIWANYWGPYRPKQPYLSRNSAQSTCATIEITPWRIWRQNQVYTRKTKCSCRCPIKVTNQNYPKKNLPQENYAIDENIECPVDFKTLQKKQQKANIAGEEIILGHTRLQTITKKGKKKIIIPKKLQSSIIQWYHLNLHHPGQTRTLQTIQEHFDWPGMTSKIKEYEKAREVCQKFKLTAPKKYGKIPKQNVIHIAPIKHIQVDLAGLWKNHPEHKDGKQTLNQIYMLTTLYIWSNWIKIHPITNKQSANIVQIFDNKWLCWYLRPQEVTNNTEGELSGFEFQELPQSYEIIQKPTI